MPANALTRGAAERLSAAVLQRAARGGALHTWLLNQKPATVEGHDAGTGVAANQTYHRGKWSAASAPAQATESKDEGRQPKQARPVPAAGRGLPEAGGPAGKEPTRFGDWEVKGRSFDF